MTSSSIKMPKEACFQMRPSFVDPGIFPALKLLSRTTAYDLDFRHWISVMILYLLRKSMSVSFSSILFMSSLLKHFSISGQSINFIAVKILKLKFTRSASLRYVYRSNFSFACESLISIFYSFLIIALLISIYSFF